MDRVVLGRTGLSVSVAGLGCGGHSRLGQARNASAEESIRLVQGALDLGINYIDTAQAYGTEEIVGRALEHRRDEVVLSTKSLVRRGASAPADAVELRRAVEESLVKLRTDTIDVYHLHGVLRDDYRYCVEELLPVLVALREEGSLRYFALSEAFPDDLEHEMLDEAIADGHWDVVMVGFNVLNHSARWRMLPAAIATDIGVEVMYAVRSALSQPELLQRLLADATATGALEVGALNLEDPLGFLVHEDGAASVIDAAYRFARHEPGCHVVLTGTGSLEHLASNVASINAARLPEADLARLDELFGHLAVFAGN